MKARTWRNTPRMFALLVIGMAIWLLADNLFHYRSMFALYILAYFGFVTIVIPEFVSWVKLISTHALEEASPGKKTEPQLEIISDSVMEIREKLRQFDFVPYSVSVRVDCRASKLCALTQKLGFSDDKGLINGVTSSEARPGFEFWRGISFQVLSGDEDGHPQLVYRLDGKTARFQSGVRELRRSIEEFTLEDVRDDALPAEFKEAFKALSGPDHPVLCFGTLLRDSSDTYQVAIEVGEDWWNNISPKPEIECEIVRRGDENGPYVCVYLILARIPRWAIHGRGHHTWNAEVLKLHQSQLEELGWTIVERGSMEHDFVHIYRQDLNGKSTVASQYE